MEKIKLSSFLKEAKRVDEVFSEVCVEYGEIKALRDFFVNDIYEINDEFSFECINYCEEKDDEISYIFRRKTDKKTFELKLTTDFLSGYFLYEKEASTSVNMQ